MNILIWNLFFVLVFEIENTRSNEEIEESVIKCGMGRIRGLRDKQDGYYKYLGIPYAKLGWNVFGTSASYTTFPYPSFEKIFTAFNESEMCPQIEKQTKTVIGSLDCLRLNVYVPQAAILKTNKKSSLVPVMVWIYNGNFPKEHTTGVTFDPVYLVRNKVIVVTFNYRTGPYGFMCLDTPEVPGNQGLKDQYLALKWVKENIRSFGGDPNAITLFGEGQFIDLHLLSPKNILFNKVILQSSTAESVPIDNPDTTIPIKLAKEIGFETNNTKEALKFLANVDPKKVIITASIMELEFKPCVEKIHFNVEPFISFNWINAKIPNVEDMPVLIGFNKYESAVFLYSEKDEYFDNSLQTVHNSLGKHFDFSKIDFNELKNIVFHYYIGEELLKEKVKWGVIRFDSDFNYIHPIHRTIKKYIANGAGNIYFYMFSYVGKRNAVFTNIPNEEATSKEYCCSSHGDDANYLFDTNDRHHFASTDYMIMRRMCSMWTQFAKVGDPSLVENGALSFKWKPVTNTSLNYLNIDSELTHGQRPFHNRMAFWDLFYSNNRKYQRGYEESPGNW